jgi:hypothetical protein
MAPLPHGPRLIGFEQALAHPPLEHARPFPGLHGRHVGLAQACGLIELQPVVSIEGEEPVEHRAMVMEVLIHTGAETVHKGHRPEPRPSAGLAELRFEEGPARRCAEPGRRAVGRVQENNGRA